MAALTGVILAGGQGHRMGGEDKGLLLLNGVPLYQHVLQRLEPQVDIVMVSANRNIDRYQMKGYQVVKDSVADYLGPLGGMLSTLSVISGDWAVFCPCDTPDVPFNYVQQLWQQKGNAPAVWVRSQERDHPTLSLIHKDVVEALTDYLQRGERRLMSFLLEQGGHAVQFSDNELAFRNINTPEDLLK